LVIAFYKSNTLQQLHKDNNQKHTAVCTDDCNVQISHTWKCNYKKVILLGNVCT